MASVTNRIKQIKQPRGGYLPVKLFTKEELDDGVDLYETENVHSSLVGMAVDYLTRYLTGATVDEAFHISTLGARVIGKEDVAIQLKQKIYGLEDESVIAACKLAGFDVCYRSGILGYKPVEEINPDYYTIENIKNMVKRSVSLLAIYGPIICSEPTFEGGYTEQVSAGDGDYVTADSLWDFKVSKSSPNSTHTLQLLMYYLMAMHSIHDYYKGIKFLRIYNPRTNILYTCEISNIDYYILAEVESQVIGYDKPLFADTNKIVSTSKRNSSNQIIEAKTITKTFKSDGLFSKEYTEVTTIKTLRDDNKTKIQATKEMKSNKNKKLTKITVDDSDYTIDDVIRISGKSRTELYADIESGKLMALTHKGKRYIPKIELELYLQKIEEQNKINKEILIGVVIAVLLLIVFVLIK